jgi:hypothetical protein
MESSGEAKPMSVVMPPMGVAAALVIVVKMPDRDQPIGAFDMGEDYDHPRWLPLWRGSL